MFQLLQGNRNSYGVVAFVFGKPLDAKAIRFHPRSYNLAIQMAVGVWGCYVDTGKYQNIPNFTLHTWLHYHLHLCEPKNISNQS